MKTDRELMQQALDALEVCKTDPTGYTPHRRLRNQAITDLQERLMQEDDHRPEAAHVVLEKGTNAFLCTRCGQRYQINMPVPISIMTAIIDAFIRAHHECQKTEEA